MCAQGSLMLADLVLSSSDKAAYLITMSKEQVSVMLDEILDYVGKNLNFLRSSRYMNLMKIIAATIPIDGKYVESLVTLDKRHFYFIPAVEDFLVVFIKNKKLHLRKKKNGYGFDNPKLDNRFVNNYLAKQSGIIVISNILADPEMGKNWRSVSAERVFTMFDDLLAAKEKDISWPGFVETVDRAIATIIEIYGMDTATGKFVLMMNTPSRSLWISDRLYTVICDMIDNGIDPFDMTNEGGTPVLSIYPERDFLDFTSEGFMTSLGRNKIKTFGDTLSHAVQKITGTEKRVESDSRCIDLGENGGLFFL